MQLGNGRGYWHWALQVGTGRCSWELGAAIGNCALQLGSATWEQGTAIAQRRAEPRISLALLRGHPLGHSHTAHSQSSLYPRGHSHTAHSHSSRALLNTSRPREVLVATSQKLSGNCLARGGAVLRALWKAEGLPLADLGCLLAQGAPPPHPLLPLPSTGGRSCVEKHVTRQCLGSLGLLAPQRWAPRPGVVGAMNGPEAAP